MVPKKTDNPSVPTSPEEIAETVKACAEIGITSVHLHARMSDGEPDWRPEPFAATIKLIRQTCPDLIICVTTSGRTVTELEKRAAVLDLSGEAKPDMASLTLSSMNFSREASINAPKTVVALAEKMKQRGIIPELEIFDTGMVNYARYLIKKGVLSSPFVANLILGGVATAQAEAGEVGLLTSRLPPRTMWAIGGIGSSQLPANLLGIALGGGVRVGLEDNLSLNSEGHLATNEDLLKRVVQIAALADRPVMTPTQFRNDIQERAEGRRQ